MVNAVSLVTPSVESRKGPSSNVLAVDCFSSRIVGPQKRKDPLGAGLWIRCSWRSVIAHHHLEALESWRSTATRHRLRHLKGTATPGSRRERTVDAGICRGAALNE